MESVPPFSSHLGAELWETKSQLVLRFSMNGEVINIENSDTIEVEKFIKKYVEPK